MMRDICAHISVRGSPFFLHTSHNNKRLDDINSKVIDGQIYCEIGVFGCALIRMLTNFIV